MSGTNDIGVEVEQAADILVEEPITEVGTSTDAAEEFNKNEEETDVDKIIDGLLTEIQIDLLKRISVVLNSGGDSQHLNLLVYAYKTLLFENG